MGHQHAKPPSREKPKPVLCVLSSTVAASTFLLQFMPMASSFHHGHLTRSISTTTTRLIGAGWIDKIKGAITGKTAQEAAKPSFSLVEFANQIDTARKMGSFKDFVVGRCSEATISNSFEKQAAILRYLGSIDPSGENLQSSQKQDAAKHCNCTMADVENALAKFTWAKDAQKEIEKLKEEGKPMPKSFAEVQKLMGTSPLDIAQSNLAKTRRVSKNALCPCGSNKKYKRCCGTSEW